MIEKYIEMKLSTQTGDFSIFFKSVEDIEKFNDFLNRLIEGVKTKMLEELRDKMYENHQKNLWG